MMSKVIKTAARMATVCCLTCLAVVLLSSQVLAEEGSDTRGSGEQTSTMQGSDTRENDTTKKAGNSGIRPAEGGLFGSFEKQMDEVKAKASAASMDSGNKMRVSMDGSSTREEPTDAPTVSRKRARRKYSRLQPTQVDPELSEEVEDAAAEIDRLVQEKLKAEKIRPNPMTNDMQFVRRVYLDITGTIPTARQTAAFLKKGRSSNKRAELIDELLNSPGYVSHSFNYWADLLRLHDSPSNNNFGLPYIEWIKDVLASDMPYDDFVYQMLSAEGRVWENPGAGYTLRDLGMPLSNLDNTVRIFLGTRIGCAQCHDHPFDRWTQKEFYHLAAFIHGTKTNANRKQINKAVSMARREMRALPETNQNSRLRQRLNQFVTFNQRAVGEDVWRRLKLPRDYQYDDGQPGEEVEPRVIFGNQPELEPRSSRREAFANWLTSPDNPRFTLTIANRLWKKVFGVGVIEPVDDITDESEPTNPELMEFLIAELKRVDYSQREFLRILYNTKTYQRESTRRDLVAEEPYHFSGPILRRMTAEQIWDSLLTLTVADPNRYQRPTSDEMLKVASISPDESLDMDALVAKMKRRNQERRSGMEAMMRKEYSHKGELLVRASEMRQPVSPSHFLRQFGQSDRQLLAGGTTEGHVPQILTMFNGPISHKLLNEGTVIYDEVMAAPDLRDKIDVVFLSILSRKPTRTDRKLASAEIQSNGPAGFGNVIWALLNTREFLFIQ